MLSVRVLVWCFWFLDDGDVVGFYDVDDPSLECTFWTKWKNERTRRCLCFLWRYVFHSSCQISGSSDVANHKMWNIVKVQKYLIYYLMRLSFPFISRYLRITSKRRFWQWEDFEDWIKFRDYKCTIVDDLKAHRLPRPGHCRQPKSIVRHNQTHKPSTNCADRTDKSGW